MKPPSAQATALSIEAVIPNSRYNNLIYSYSSSPICTRCQLRRSNEDGIDEFETAFLGEETGQRLGASSLLDKGAFDQVSCAYKLAMGSGQFQMRQQRLNFWITAFEETDQISLPVPLAEE